MLLTWNDIKTFVNKMDSVDLKEEVKIGLDDTIINARKILRDASCIDLGPTYLIDCAV